MGSLIKVSTSCSKVIKRTLQSDTNWLRHSSFVWFQGQNYPSFERDHFRATKLPILRAWPLFEHFKTLKPTLAKHDNVSNKKKNFEIRNGMTCRECERILISSIEKLSILCGTCWKIPQYRHLTREIAVSEKAVLTFLTWF